MHCTLFDLADCAFFFLLLGLFWRNRSNRVQPIVLSFLVPGRPLALIDGTELTLWRTACASALAADYLARKDVKVMVMVGAGALAPHLISAHLTSRPSLQRILVWNRTHSNALQLVKSLKKLPIFKGKEIEAVVELESAVRCGDLITCATLSSEPLVLGMWLSPGAHLDLVGSFTPSMRECDDEAVRVARIFVDTEGASKESGDLDGPLKRGVILEGQIVGTLPDLVRGKMSGRRSDQEITLFKSVGSALEDLAAAQLVYEKIST